MLYILCFVVLSVIALWGLGLLAGSFQARSLPPRKEVARFIGFTALAVVCMVILFSI